MKGLDNADILHLLSVADHLMLPDLHEDVQTHLLNKETEWLRQNFGLVYQTVSKLKSSQKLKDHCIDLICKTPEVLFQADDFNLMDEQSFIPLLKRDDLNMEEIDIWNILLKWGITKNPSLSSNFKDWSTENILNLQQTLENLIPLIRFSEINSVDFYNMVLPYKQIFPTDLFSEIERYYYIPSAIPKSINTKPRYKLINSVIITSEDDITMINKWLGENTRWNGKIPLFKYDYKLLMRGSRDGFTASAFHERCDNQGSTIVLIKTTINSHEIIVGGYTPVPWTSVPSWHKSRVPICHCKEYGPQFGENDICIGNIFNVDKGISFSPSSYPKLIESNYGFSVSLTLWSKIDEIEVFQIEKKIIKR
ncbi:8113_t:CDS:2 [Scutellospora calospora]|uniref:8113_t:CDS:1 n=1 Tax=Scutellospora calospora TaxID=85575 RepID=A0ACA9L5D1_9GLOM|nr:8113_t:CDS:2 [Scutellospora calospora]